MASFYDVTAERYLPYQVYTIFQENPRSMNAEKMYLSIFIIVYKAKVQTHLQTKTSKNLKPDETTSLG